MSDQLEGLPGSLTDSTHTYPPTSGSRSSGKAATIKQSLVEKYLPYSKGPRPSDREDDRSNRPRGDPEDQSQLTSTVKTFFTDSLSYLTSSSRVSSQNETATQSEDTPIQHYTANSSTPPDLAAALTTSHTPVSTVHFTTPSNFPSTDKPFTPSNPAPPKQLSTPAPPKQLFIPADPTSVGQPSTPTNPASTERLITPTNPASTERLITPTNPPSTERLITPSNPPSTIQPITPSNPPSIVHPITPSNHALTAGSAMPPISPTCPFTFGQVDVYSSDLNNNNKRRRIGSDEPEVRADEQRIASTNLTMDFVLRIMDEREKYSRLSIVEEIRRLLASAPRPVSGLSLKKLREILAGCMDSDNRSTASNPRDVDMEASPANSREVAEIIWNAMVKEGLDAGSPIVPHATTNLVNGSARSQLPVAVASTSAISPPAPEGKNAELPVLFKPRTPKSSDRNKFLSDLRNFLNKEGVRLRAYKKGEPAPTLPECALAQDVLNFNKNNSSRPSPDKILLAWSESLTSDWNQECISLLAHKAKTALSSEVYAALYRDEWLTMRSLRKQIETALFATKSHFCSSDSSTYNPSSTGHTDVPMGDVSQPNGKTSRDKKRRRHRKRAKVVGRKDTCQYFTSKPGFGAAEDVLNAVGLDGMSGEETDDSEDSAGREKILVSIPVDWINPALADIFHVIDDWKSVKDGETFRDARGNRPLARGTKRKRPVNSKPVAGLPRNWYNDMWYRQLHDGKRKLLDATEELSIPSLPAAPTTNRGSTRGSCERMSH